MICILCYMNVIIEVYMISTCIHSGFVICSLLFLSPNTDAKHKKHRVSPKQKKCFRRIRVLQARRMDRHLSFFFHHFGVLNLDHVPTSSLT